MNKFDSTPSLIRIGPTSEGWLVQVYGGDRRLLCVLDSSHAWTFLWGFGVGLLLAVAWGNLVSNSPSTTYESSNTPPALSIAS